jgi:uncharacterized protein (TIRG00374 family)
VLVPGQGAVKDHCVNKKLAVNLLKYAVAVALLTWVIWSNWGYRDRTAATISDASSISDQTAHAGKPTFEGTVVAYHAGDSITIKTASDSELHFDLTKKTRILTDDDEPLTEGSTVAIWEGPRGLSYVWHHHVLAGEEKIHLHFFFFALFVYSIAAVITLIRWWTLVCAQDIPLSLSDAIRLGCVGIFFNTFLPGSVGGDIVKAAFIVRERKDRRTIAVATILLDRAIALWALFFLMTVAGSIFWAAGMLDKPVAQRLVTMVAILVSVSLATWFLLGLLPQWRAQRFAGRLARLPKVGHALAEVWNAVWIYRCRQRSVAVALVLSWIGHLGFVFVYFWAAQTLTPPSQVPSLAEHFIIIPIGMVIQALPLLPGGAGISELGFGELYQLFGYAVAAGVLMSLVQRVVVWMVGGVCYFVYLRMKPAIQAAVHEAEAEPEPAPLPKKMAC